MKPAAPKIASVDVVAAQPSEAESAKISHLNVVSDRPLPNVAYVAKIRLDKKPPPTSIAWRLYVNDELIPKYWEYSEGIYFTVLDPEFFIKHRGEPLRFSLNGVEFYNTGKKLTGFTEFSPDAVADVQTAKKKKAKSKASSKKRVGRRSAKRLPPTLPAQSEVLKD